MTRDLTFSVYASYLVSPSRRQLLRALFSLRRRPRISLTSSRVFPQLRVPVGVTSLSVTARGAGGGGGSVGGGAGGGASYSPPTQVSGPHTFTVGEGGSGGPGGS